MSTDDEHKKSRLGRPSVDSELLRARVGRPLLSALDAYAASENNPLTRPQAIRAILADWLRTHGLLKGDHPEPVGPATEVIKKMDAEIDEHRRAKTKDRRKATKA